MSKNQSHLQIYPWQNGVWDDLIRRGLPHSILFYGASDIGKFEFGLTLAKFILCENKQGIHACDECDACLWFGSGNHPDFVIAIPEELEGRLNFFKREDDSSSGPNKASKSSEEDKKQSKFIRIDQIRDVISNVEIRSHRGQSKVVLVYPVDAMQSAAANSLLKTLEEPPVNVIMILIANQIDKILPTIRSRCQLLAMPNPSYEQSMDWLKKQVVHLNISADTISSILKSTGGSALKTLRILESKESSYSDERVLKFLLMAPAVNCQDILDVISSFSISEFVDTLQKLVHDLILMKAGIEPKYFPDYIKFSKDLFSRLDLNSLLIFSKILNESKKRSSHALNNKIQIEQILVQYNNLFK